MSTTVGQQAPETFAKALGRVASGIYIISTGRLPDAQGMLTSWVMQAGFEPPQLTIAVARERSILPKLAVGSMLVVNILGEQSNELMKPFVKTQDNAFESLSTEQNEFGVILKDAVAFLNAEVKDQWVLGDHVVLQCLVHEGKMLREDIQPWVHVRKNGFNY
ncbi:MAG: flavin reductase [Cyanobacteria bacterium HKST-UBA06]|nr:flavin reductase [Cyanobacteria bacterium HKST-UBA05]MCA9799302.1 flavin reductase [Cyanobacteria bacterium HKST-UBA04]MCA9806387.1 flavin reductase [Cyanobacteria bacterium HKST-UBA06]MCA9842456.1 flavin reductase [Cyanobacteria bacterium HKST-UBA03]